MIQVIPERDSPITDEETVHLMSSNVAEFFEPFFLTTSNALVMTIGVYLNILRFMQKSWPNVLKSIKTKIALLQSPAFPMQLAKNLTITSKGNVIYERWFDVCFFQYLESSSDTKETKRFIHLQIKNKSIKLEPNVLYNMSLQYNTLLNILTRAGYIYRGHISENLQFNNEL